MTSCNWLKENFYRVFFVFTAFIFLFSSYRRAPDNGIKTGITQLRSNKGHVLVSLFKEGAGYPDEPEKAFRKEKLEITGLAASVLFSDLPPGRYAIAILHDENDDRKMNKNFFGLPKEGYGFSNNVMGTFGPPSFTKANFLYTADGSVALNIKARY